MLFSTANLLLASVIMNLLTLTWLVALQFARTAGADALPTLPDLTRERKLFEAQRLYEELVETMDDPEDVTTRDIYSSLFGLFVSARIRLKEKHTSGNKKLDT